MSHCACSSTQSSTRGPRMYDRNVMLRWYGMASCSTCGFIPRYKRKLRRNGLLSSLSPWNSLGGLPPYFPVRAGGPVGAPPPPPGITPPPPPPPPPRTTPAARPPPRPAPPLPVTTTRSCPIRSVDAGAVVV